MPSPSPDAFVSNLHNLLALVAFLPGSLLAVLVVVALARAAESLSLVRPRGCGSVHHVGDPGRLERRRETEWRRGARLRACWSAPAHSPDCPIECRQTRIVASTSTASSSVSARRGWPSSAAASSRRSMMPSWVHSVDGFGASTMRKISALLAVGASRAGLCWIENVMPVRVVVVGSGAERWSCTSTIRQPVLTGQ